MSTTTLTIGELYMHIKAVGLGGEVIDTAVASEFDVEIEFDYSAGHPGNLSGRWEDAEEPILPTLEIRSIKAESSVHFAGDAGDYTIKRGTDLLALFTGKEVTALEDRIYAEIQNG